MPTLGSSVKRTQHDLKIKVSSLVRSFKSNADYQLSGHMCEPTRKENKHLVGGVIVVGHQYGEVCPPGATLAGLVSELTLELLQRLVQLVLCHQVSSVMAQLRS